MKKILLILTLLIVGLMSIGIASAGTITASSTAPVIDGEDIGNVNLIDTRTDLKYEFRTTTNTGTGTGQTFKIGSDGTVLNSLTLRLQNGETNPSYEVRIVEISSPIPTSGSGNPPINVGLIKHTETFTSSININPFDFVTFVFNTPLELESGKQYGIDVRKLTAGGQKAGTFWNSDSYTAYDSSKQIAYWFQNSVPLTLRMSKYSGSSDADLVFHLDIGTAGCDDYTTDLIAGGGNPKSAIDVGEVTASSDGETLEVTYETEDGWEITETHLDIECTADEIPQKNGNPIPGKFDYSSDFEPGVTEHTVSINLEDLCCTDPVIAAHAVVQKETLLNPTPYYADKVVDYLQGPRKDGTPVRPGRSTPEQGLAFETGRDETNFFSLGFGGWMTAEFNCPIRNGEGNDVKVIEDTWGSYPLEKAEVYASNDGVNWVYIGLADNTVRDPVYNIHTIAEFDLGSMTEAKYIKIVDVSDPAVHNNEGDGYDLNAIEALQNCVEIQEETAWGQGPGFPGKNWAMYFTYDLSDCYDAECSGQESSQITGAAVASSTETTWLGLISVLSITALAVVAFNSTNSLKKKK